MSEQNDSLFFLIKSLNRVEKIHFKRYVNQQATDEKQAYIFLFDLIEKADHYDKEKFAAYLHLKNITNNYAETKQYLYTKLVEFLTDFHIKSNKLKQLEYEIAKAQMLFDREMYNESYKVLSNSKDTAIKYNYHIQLLKILHLQALLVNKVYTRDFDSLYESICNEQIQTIDLLKNTIELQTLNIRMHTYYLHGFRMRDTDSESRIDSIIQHPLMQDSKRAKTRKAQQLYYQTYIYYYIFKSDKEKLFEAHQHFLNLYDSLDRDHEFTDFHYHMVLSNYLLLAISLRKFDYLEKYNKQIESYRSSNIPYQNRITFLSQLIKCKLAILTADENIIFYTLKNIQHSCKRFIKNQAYKEFYYLFHHYHFYAFFLKADYKKCNIHLEEILKDSKGEVRKDIINFARILKIIVDFELKKFDLIDYAVVSTKSLLKRQNQLFELENLILNHLKGLAYIAHSSEIAEKFKILRNKLQDEKYRSPLDLLSDMFDLDSWIISKIKSKPMASILREKAHINYPTILNLSLFQITD